MIVSGRIAGVDRSHVDGHLDRGLLDGIVDADFPIDADEAAADLRQSKVAADEGDFGVSGSKPTSHRFDRRRTWRLSAVLTIRHPGTTITVPSRVLGATRRTLRSQPHRGG